MVYLVHVVRPEAHRADGVCACIVDAADEAAARSAASAACPPGGGPLPAPAWAVVELGGVLPLVCQGHVKGNGIGRFRGA
jgi:hypothetical protein